MKNERGSALLTVVLIVFVSVTIGAALSSFIMMNYKLRDLDNRIGRAEYEAEKIIDVAYLAAQGVVKQAIDEKIVEARNTIEQEIQDEIDDFNNDQTQTSGFEYLDIINGAYEININKKRNKSYEEFKKKYKEYIEGALMRDIHGKIGGVLHKFPDLHYDANTFGKSGNDIEIALEGEFREEGTKFVQSLTVHYKNQNSPVIQYSVDLIINVPTYDQADTGGYDLAALVGITNWQMQDWGYL